MKLSRFFIIITLISYLSTVKGQNITKYDFSPIDRLINQWIIKDYYPGASIIIAKNDSIVFEKYYGYYTPETPVFVASASKWLAAATIATVVDKSKLSWEDKVEDLLSEFRGDYKGQIKLKQLLSHTSGIPDYFPLPEVDTFSVLQKSVQRIAKLDTVFKPGSRFQYGGLAMQVAGRMAEVAMNKNFESIFQENIALPLNMKNTHFVPINKAGGHSPMLAGSVQTVLHDYISFLKMIYNNGNFNAKQVLSKESIIEMQANQIGKAKIMPDGYVEKVLGQSHTGIYGLGEWREKVDKNGNAYQISSPGWAGAYPWINKRDSVYGFFLTHVEDVESAAWKRDKFSPFDNAHIISELTSLIVNVR